MPTSFAPSAAPDNAMLVWADGRYIYIELATPPGVPPCVMSFQRSAIGLAKAINLIYQHAEVVGTPINPTRKLVGTPVQHGMAQALLRRNGAIK